MPATGGPARSGLFSRRETAGDVSKCLSWPEALTGCRADLDPLTIFAPFLVFLSAIAGPPSSDCHQPLILRDSNLTISRAFPHATCRDFPYKINAAPLLVLSCRTVRL